MARSRFLLLLLAACVQTEGPTVVITPDTQVPDIRIGVVTGAASFTIGGGPALVLSQPDGGLPVELAAGTVATVTAGVAGLQIRFAGITQSPGPAVLLSSADTAVAVRLNGRDYRGRFLLTATLTGVTAVNQVGIEDYLTGVVGAEMGRRTELELEALRAQAVLSRTIALKALSGSRWRGRGYDLVATVADQAYAGIPFEFPAGVQAVRDTRGLVLMFEGQLIDGFFHSTCGGRTADGVEVFAGADRPYLRSIRDEDPSGRPWCAISPRFRWQERWSGELLARTLARTLPANGGSVQLARTLRDIRVLDRTATGRVAHLEFSGPGGLTVTGPVARLVLQGQDGSILRSANFNLQVSRSGGRIVELVADGAGAGHGVGMCQWGALARARAGHSYQDILSAYFPGTAVTRAY